MRANEKDNQQLLEKALYFMPSTPKYALLGCLEYSGVSARLAQIIEQEFLALSKATAPDIFYLSALLRALAGAPWQYRESVTEHIFSHDFLQHKEILIAIAGRCWEVLEDNLRLERFLLLVIQQGDKRFFEQILADIALLPSIRTFLFTVLHKGGKLATAIQGLKKKA